MQREPSADRAFLAFPDDFTPLLPKAWIPDHYIFILSVFELYSMENTATILRGLVSFISPDYCFLSFLQVGMCSCSWFFFFFFDALLYFLYDFNHGSVTHFTLGGHLDHLWAWLPWRKLPGLRVRVSGRMCARVSMGVYAEADACVRIFSFGRRSLTVVVSGSLCHYSTPACSSSGFKFLHGLMKANKGGGSMSKNSEQRGSKK